MVYPAPVFYLKTSPATKVAGLKQKKMKDEEEEFDRDLGFKIDQEDGTNWLIIGCALMTVVFALFGLGCIVVVVFDLL